VIGRITRHAGGDTASATRGALPRESGRGRPLLELSDRAGIVRRMTKLSGTEISAAVTDRGWRYVLRSVSRSVPVSSLAEAAELAARVAAAAGPAADGSLRLDVRTDRLLVEVADDAVTAGGGELVDRISAVLGAPAGPPPVQRLEIGIDALDIPAVLPFWRAVLDYVDEPGGDDSIMDPGGQGPAVWFQQMDAPRPQRNRIHIDVSVPHDEAEVRIKATLAAGGTLVSDAAAPAFWVLADPEGNEACICTWQNRD
jgi:4a-hydroxytetrahydrobiopterin dehydratase